MTPAEEKYKNSFASLQLKRLKYDHQLPKYISSEKKHVNPRTQPLVDTNVIVERATNLSYHRCTGGLGLSHKILRIRNYAYGKLTYNLNYHLISLFCGPFKVMPLFKLAKLRLVFPKFIF